MRVIPQWNFNMIPRAGLSIVSVVPWEGAPDKLPIFYHAVLTLADFLAEEKCIPREKILGTRMKKGPPPYVGMGPPEWLIRP